MAIESWSDITAIENYLIPNLNKPQAVNIVNVVALGPVALNASDGDLLSRYWMAYQENGQVKIVGSVN